MKALLLKDFYMMKKYCKLFLLMELVFVVLSLIPDGNMFFLYYPVVFGGMLPVSLLTHDEKNKWDAYCGTLPYTKAQLVSVKYLIGLIIQLIFLAISGITHAVKLNLEGNFHFNEYLLMMAMLLILACIASAGCFPFLFKYGVEKGGIAYFLMIGIVSAGSGVAAAILDDGIQGKIGFGTPIILTMVVVIALYALSWYLSIRFYEKREIS